MKSLRLGLLAAACAALFSSNAMASLVYQSADYIAAENGAYLIDNTDFVGATFQLTSTTDVSAIGGHFSQFSDSQIFGAIVSVASPTSLPSTDIASTSLAHVLFTGDGSDQLISFASNVQLSAGYYAVVFGSGLFGATGTSGLVSGQDGIAANPIAFDGTNWAASSNSDVRLTVDGTPSPVPLPATLPLLLSGLASLGLFGRRKRNTA